MAPHFPSSLTFIVIFWSSTTGPKLFGLPFTWNKFPALQTKKFSLGYDLEWKEIYIFPTENGLEMYAFLNTSKNHP